MFTLMRWGRRFRLPRLRQQPVFVPESHTPPIEAIRPSPQTYALVCLPLISSDETRAGVNIYLVEAWVWVLLPGLAAVGAGVLAWFVMQSRMDMALARERERMANQRGKLAEQRGAMRAERGAMGSVMQAAVRAAEETARRKALEDFLGQLRVEQRRFTRGAGPLWGSGKRLVLQERMYFRDIPLSGWIEREFTAEIGSETSPTAKIESVFERGVVNIATLPRPAKSLAAGEPAAKPATRG